MNKKGLLKLIILIVILLVVGFFLFFNKYKILHETKEECPGLNCVKVQTTCCPCSSGGKEACVNKTEAKYYEEKLKNECPQEGLVCPAVYSCIDLSCNKTNKT